MGTQAELIGVHGHLYDNFLPEDKENYASLNVKLPKDT